MKRPQRALDPEYSRIIAERDAQACHDLAKIATCLLFAITVITIGLRLLG